jgi:hypothetical protein
VLAIATFESLLGTVYGQHFALHPGALDAREKEFSLGELQEFDDISDARDVLTGRRVEAFTSMPIASFTTSGVSPRLRRPATTSWPASFAMAARCR